MSKLGIASELAAVDQKDRGFYTSLSDEERKKFSPYLMLRWGASVEGDEMFQTYYLLAANKHANRSFFDLSKHPQLQWLLCTTISPGMGKLRHYWIAPKKAGGSNKATKFLESIYPHLKDDEIALMAEVNDLKELKALAKDMGMEDKEIKAALG
jgi:hypothetical protein